MDWTGLGFSVAVGGMIAGILTALDALLLTRQIAWLNNLALRWYFYMDDLRLPNLAKIAVLRLERISKLLIFYIYPVVLIPTATSIYYVIAHQVDVGAFEFFYMQIFSRPLVLLTFPFVLGLTTLIPFMLALSLSVKTRYFPLVAVSLCSIGLYFCIKAIVLLRDIIEMGGDDIMFFIFIAIICATAPVLIYLGLVFAMLLLYASFHLFKLTTCHLLELSFEKKTIFAHLGVLIALLVVVGKGLLEVKKLMLG
ncbi:hypothetical protein EDD52_11589 [Primorskyibacter sedentarius]|uniref:Uncharacterized protein n=1 Tax=Primorskyibacter sedentarius TaxID=745311 RepID=A0A4R3J360_9RHOB|nr:hypothetical protein [Primorskyibacter sedentarius]TCS60269.1 hypothetical protein EDD52_11589 [Primorskyibacter sedentarius]